MGNKVYVLEPVFSRYGDVASVWNKVDGFRDPEFYTESLENSFVEETYLERAGPTFGGNGKIQ